jgi:hypothetical protein
LNYPKNGRSIQSFTSTNSENTTKIPPIQISPDPSLNSSRGEEEFEVEQILDANYRYRFGTRKKDLHFLIKWVGYHSKDNTWEPYDNIQNSQELLAKFYKENPTKPRYGDPIPAGPLPKIGQERKRIRILGTSTIGMVNVSDFIPLDNATDVTTWPVGPTTS